MKHESLSKIILSNAVWLFSIAIFIAFVHAFKTPIEYRYALIFGMLVITFFSFFTGYTLGTNYRKGEALDLLAHIEEGESFTIIKIHPHMKDVGVTTLYVVLRRNDGRTVFYYVDHSDFETDPFEGQTFIRRKEKLVKVKSMVEQLKEA